MGINCIYAQLSSAKMYNYCTKCRYMITLCVRIMR